MGIQYISELVQQKRHPLSANEVKRIAFDRVKRRLGLNSKKTFIEGMRVVWKANTPFGVIVLVEVEGHSWRYWTSM